jgi:hypothetical protein
MHEKVWHLNKGIHYWEAVEAIREGLKDMEEGRVQDARTALEELWKGLGFDREPEGSSS